MRDLEGRVEDGVIADAAGMDIGLVGEIHEIVDDEAPVALEAGERAAFASPFGSVVPMEIGHFSGVRERRVARPDPYQPMPLDYRICADACGRVDRLLRGHVRASSGRIEDEAVIAADQFVADKTP